MHRLIPQLGCVWLACCCAIVAEDHVDFFETRIRPVLAERCYMCHSAEAEQGGALKGELRLDSRAGMLRGGLSGPAVVPGSVEQSLLISALKHESFEMPPSGKLPDSVIADFIQWIEVGAPDPRDSHPGATRHSQTAAIPDPLNHWAFQPRKNPTLPEVTNRTWPRDDLDRFVLAGLEATGHVPAREADRRTWIRRVSYDLVGLPPSQAQVSRLVDSKDPGTQATIVDEMLDSPHFGVRWARFWLDNVRFSQDDYTCCAFATNEFDPTPYRDWLVRAFNDDLHYDAFVRLQIAGDLVPHEDPERVNTDGITATGVWTFPHIIADNDPDKVIVDFVDQQVDVLGRTFIGLTLACARCHDHKFDPITQQDYYALAGIFFSSHSLTHAHPDTGDASRVRAAYRVQVPIFSTQQQLRDYQQQVSKIGQLQSELTQLKRRHSGVFDLRAVRGRIKQQLQRKLENDEERQDRDSVVARLRKQEAALLKKTDPSFVKEHSEQLYARHDRLAKQLKELREPIRKLARRPAMLEGGSPGTRYGGQIKDVPVFIRGDHNRRGKVVPRAFPTVLCWRAEPSIGLRTANSGRLELADWLVDPEHPLTARVMVNRLWQQLFGRGLVSTPSNFGRLGARPSHPDLLDHLANRFVDSGWSVKRLLRDIVLSATYRQDSRVSQLSSQADPDNLLLGRMNRKRLHAEQLRDSLQLLAGRIRYDADADKLHQSGRALYVKVTRFESPDELLFQFDAPDPSLVVPQRSESTAATQALFMLNNPLVMDVVEHWSARLCKSEATDRERLFEAFGQLFGRRPNQHECHVAFEALSSFRRQRQAELAGPDNKSKRQTDSERLAWQDLCHVLLCGNEFLYVD